MSPRAGIVVTGTEVITGRISDRNGPWLADRLEELGVELSQITIVGDRPADIEGALRFLAGEGVDLIVTSGGLGPTADDLTAEVVGRFQGREMLLDDELEQRIADILAPLMKRWPGLDPEAVRESNRKQAVVPEGSTILGPVGTAPGLVVPPGEGGAGPTVVVLPGPPRELHPLWHDAVATDAFQRAVRGRTQYERAVLRLFGIPESEIAETLRLAEQAGIALGDLEITTCLRRGEIEVDTRYEPPAAGTYAAFADFVRQRHSDTLFSDDGTTIDEQVAALFAGTPGRTVTVAVAESCTGGLVAARLTDRPGSSEYVLGGVVAYSNEAKADLVGVDPGLVAQFGAVSTEVAEALAEGARERFGADVGVGVTGVAGPGGGTEDKPVGFVCFSVVGPDGRLTRSATLPGGRPDVRDRATTVTMHLLRRLLRGEADLPGA